ncbi:MAG: hypothetical protein OSB69_07835 [Alphaproteobacteria bacterium]|nr:hypothetical protein [Alphaproteobacteria bacterium]
MLRTHGWLDSTVPLEGQPIWGGGIHQNNIFQGLKLRRAENGCDAGRPDKFSTKGCFWRRASASCDPSTVLQMAVYAGGQGVPGADRPWRSTGSSMSYRPVKPAAD